jgi:hypothetical protein
MLHLLANDDPEIRFWATAFVMALVFVIIPLIKKSTKKP